MKRSLLFLFCSAAFAPAETLTPTKDSDVYSYLGPNGGPTSTIFSLGVSSTPPESVTLHSQKTLIQFNTSAITIPAGEIGSAKLRLFVIPPSAEFGTLSPGNVHVHRQASAWGPVTGAFPQWATFQSAAEIGVIPITIASSETWVEVDITATVIAWKNGSVPDNGLFLAPFTDRLSPTLNVTFTSMEVPGYEPQLVVTRKVSTPILSIASSGGAITVKWPVTGSEGWTLQRTTNLATGPWVANTDAVTTVYCNYQIQPSNVGREFFRLVKP